MFAKMFSVKAGRAFRLPLLVVLLGLLSASLVLAGCGCEPAEEEKGEVVFGDLNWDSALFHNRVAMFIVEHGYGYEVDSVPGDTISLWTGLRRGDIDVYMETWIANMREAYNEGIGDGEVIDLGTNFDDNVQGWWVPTYVIEGDEERGIEPMAPDLRSVEDLPEYWELFQDPEEPDKGRFYSCIPGWECEMINEKKFEVYGLDEYFTIFNPGSDAALAASIGKAYERGEPWFGYYWGPTWVMGLYDMTLIEEPPYDEEVWEDNYGCAYPASDVNICVHEGVPDRFPEVTEFLKNYESTEAITSEALAFMREEDEEADAAAIWFLKEYEDLWTQWVPEDVAARVKENL